MTRPPMTRPPMTRPPMTPGGRFAIQPNPPLAGSPAKITYTGDAKTITVCVAGGACKEHSVPPKEVTIDTVPDAPSLSAFDETDDPDGSARWPIERTLGEHR